MGIAGVAGRFLFEALVMGKLVCSELAAEGLDFMGLLVALVIAMTLMILCSRPPRRTVIAVHRYA
ncbi:hypothetical protein CFP56_021213 [Quercus suber]|uniref:Uncharacterized protein n=1 Tax=Quercus suber TaxID=58331 RepID=A0AAW0KDP9_QUESU